MAGALKKLQRVGQAAEKATAQALSKQKPPAFGGSYDDSVLRRTKEEFMTTYGMDFGQGLSRDYDFVAIDRIKPSEKVEESRVRQLMQAIQNEDPFNTTVPPIVIDSEGNVLDGHHRIEAAKRLGIKSVPAIEKFSIKSGTKLIDSDDQKKAEGGEVDHALKAWHQKMMAQGGAVHPYGDDNCTPPIGGIGFPYKAGGELQGGADEPLMAAGGEVRMQVGGDLRSQVEKQLSAGVPVFADPGIQGQIAKQIMDEQEAARVRQEQERRAKVAGLPFADRARGVYEAGRTVQSILGQEIAKPFVGLIGGEKKIAELEEGTPLPESEAGIEYLTRFGEFLAPVGKAIEASKIPDVPFLPELGPVAYVPGVGRQVGQAVARAGRAVDQAIPETMKNLPVGGSIVPAEGTPPIPQAVSGKVKVPANELGLYSPVEKAAVNLQRKQGSGQAFLNDIMKQENVKADEIDAIGLGDWLKSQKSVTKQDVVDFIGDNKIQVQEKMRGTILSPAERSRLNEIERAISKGWYDVPDADMEWFEATKAKLRNFAEPLYEQDDLIIPGGKNYREIELQFPTKRPSLATAKSREEYNRLIDEADQSGVRNYQSTHWEDDPNVFAHIRMQDKNIDGKKTLVIEEIQSDWHQEGRDKGYFPKDKNWNELAGQARKISAEMNTVGRQRTAAIAELDRARFEQTDNWSLVDEIQKEVDDLSERYSALMDDFDRLQVELRKPPDAPFKEDWYQVALKRAIKYAADNDYDQIAIVGGDEQAKRYSLSKKVDAIGVVMQGEDRLIKVQTKGGGVVQFTVDKNGIVQSVSDEKFSKAKKKPITDVVGKNMGKRLMQMERGVVSGEGLNIGGEGMKKYYDEIYPKYLEKQYKKYGVKPQRKDITTGEYSFDDVEEIDTGEVDRFRRPVSAYIVKDRESGETIGYGGTQEEALDEANRNFPKTPLWVMDVPQNMKADVKIGQPFAKGGAVKVDKKLQSWHKIQKLAKGGVIQKLAKAGQKAARMSREEAEKAGYWHPISETKLAKPIGEYKATVIEAPETKMTPRKSVTVEELQGGVAIPLAGDRAAAGKIIKEIEGTPMDVMLEGGPDFMRMHPGAAWASGQGVLSMLAKRIKSARESGQPIYGVYTAMSPQAVDFNTMMTESLLNQLDVSGLTKKDRMAFNQAVKEVKGQGGKPKAPNFPGLDDPELREKLLSGPGGQRDAFVKAMSKAEFQKKGFPDVAAARLAVTEPELLDVPRGSSGFTVARLDPEARIFEQSGHSTYPLDIAGEYAGGLERQLPVEVMYPSHFQAKQLMGSTPAGAHKSLELFAPLQYLDQEWLDNAMKYLELQKQLTGRKKGGLARSQGIENG